MSQGEGGSWARSSACRGPRAGATRGGMLGDAQVSEDGPYDTGVGEEGEYAHLTVAPGAAQGWTS